VVSNNNPKEPTDITPWILFIVGWFCFPVILWGIGALWICKGKDQAATIGGFINLIFWIGSLAFTIYLIVLIANAEEET